MRILIFGGTTEGRILASRLSGSEHEITVSVATETGAAELCDIDGITVVTGRKDEDGMAVLLDNKDVCVDATHPYAVEAGKNILKACEKCGVSHVRLLRESPGEPSGYEKAVIVSDAAEAAEEAVKISGNIMLTTGVKELPYFDAVERQRLYVRILPVHESLKKCEEAGIPVKNIIAMHGPFSTELNAALIGQFDVKCLVTKDGGVSGGFEEKFLAAKQAGIRLIVIKRPKEEGFGLEEVINMINMQKICTLRKV